MTIEQAIIKAIEAGYVDFAGSPIEVSVEEKQWPITKFKAMRNSAELRCAIPIFHPYLDPYFWQSLGTALGWAASDKHDEYQKHWLYYWHRFIDHLAEGGTAETYFETLK